MGLQKRRYGTTATAHVFDVTITTTAAVDSRILTEQHNGLFLVVLNTLNGKKLLQKNYRRLPYVKRKKILFERETAAYEAIRVFA